MDTIQAGDTVRYIPTGEMGVVENANESHCSVKSDIGTRHCLMTENLELVNPNEIMSKFKAGDRAIFQGQVMGGINYPNPVEVTVIHTESVHSIYCQFPDGKRWYLSERELLSTQSPQPQTKSPYDAYVGWEPNKPKEDTMKPYAVIYHNLAQSASGAQIQSHHTTEEEAKEAAEALVAAQRSDQVRKNYFAVTIVNTKTGKLVGSVVDAPPAVNWKTE